MKKERTIIIEGVVAEFEGKYWGETGRDGNECDFIDNFVAAKISNPEFCTKPTDMTYDPKKTRSAIILHLTS